MAINNLEQAAMDAASTGVGKGTQSPDIFDPTYMGTQTPDVYDPNIYGTPSIGTQSPDITRVPQYADRPGDEWMSHIPEAYGQLPDVIRQQRTLQAQQLREGVPEVVRKAAQPFTRKGLFGSGLQLENIGQAALARQQAIQNAELLAKIDPLKAQIAMGDLAQQRGTQRAQESRRRYEKEESYSQQQKARDDLMKQAAGSGILSTLTGRNPVSDWIFGPQTSVLEKALLASITGGKGLGTAGTDQKSGLSKLLSSIGGIFGLGGDDTLSKLGISESEIPELQAAFEGPDDAGWVAGTSGTEGTGLLSKLGIGESEIPELQTAFGGPDFEGGWNVGADQNIPVEAYEGYGEPTDQFADLYTDSGVFLPDLESEFKFFGEDDDLPFGNTFKPTILDGLGDKQASMQEAMNQGFANAEITQKLLDEGKIGTEYASLLSDAGNYLPESGTDLLSTAGDIAKLPFQALDVGMKAVGGAKKAVGDLTTKALDTATGGAYSGITSGIRGLGGQATKAVSDLVGGVISPSTVGSLALTAATGGLKNIAKNPMQFAGQKILGSALPSFKSTVGALAKGTLPEIAWTTATPATIAAAGNTAYTAAIAKGATEAAAIAAKTKAVTAAAAAPSVLGASMVALPMLAMSIGSQQTAKQRAQGVKEEMINRSGSARFNFVPGELHMVGNKRTSPVLEEANTNFRYIDDLTNMDEIYEQDPRRSVVTSISNKSLSERGQDFAKEAGITYTNPDPDIQNTSQKWLGKQQVYSELIPELKPIFMAGIKGQMPREQVEDKVAEISNSYFVDNPSIRGVLDLNRSIEDITHQNQDDLTHVQNRIIELEKEREDLKYQVPNSWKQIAYFKPQIIIEEIIEDEQE